MSSVDDFYMQRCLDLAHKGIYYTQPNPMVGSVIVHNGKIIGEGFHTKAGEPHAEIMAINNVKNQSLLKQSTLYVNLEPCSHYGKTPPCAVKIAELHIPKVVIGIRDFSSKVNGKGIEILKSAGIEVVENILAPKAYFLNRRFFVSQHYRRPYIILKWAETQDGFIDFERRTDIPEIHWITNDLAKMLVHKGRSIESAILIGKNTALKDNPELTVRHWHNENSPWRILIDRDLTVSHKSKLFKPPVHTIIFNEQKNTTQEHVTYVKIDFFSPEHVLTQILNYLHSSNRQTLIVEGGAITLHHFIKLGLWDEYQVYKGPAYFRSGVRAPQYPELPSHKENIGDTSLLIGYNPNTTTL